MIEMHFQDQPIRDILMALAEFSGQSIIVDETVNGNATYFFSNTEFDRALTQFLDHYGIFHRKEENTWYISRIKTEVDENRLSCQADQVDIQQLIRRLSRDAEITILHDALPRDPITVHYRGESMEELLNIIIRPYPQFYLESGDRYFYLRREASNASMSGSGSTPKGTIFEKEGELYSAQMEQVRFRESLMDLMQQEGREFSFLGRNDNVIETFQHRDKTFEEMLELLLDQGNAGYTLSGDIYYIYDLDRQDILKQYYITHFLRLENVPVDSISSLIPSYLNGSGSFKLDQKQNAVILSGNLKEIEPLKQFLIELDDQQKSAALQEFQLQFLTVEEFRKILPVSLLAIPITSVDEQRFIASPGIGKMGELEEFIQMVDQPRQVYSIPLKYLTWEELQEMLPQDLPQELFTPSADFSQLLFHGSQGQWQQARQYMEMLDKPKPQIRYEVLVLQIEENQGLDLDSGLSANFTSNESSNGFSGNLAGLASLTFDVVSQFGYQFAANLSLELSKNRSRVLADTTMHGLSGEEIRFQNTNTSRIPTTQIDADSGESETTGYREITSGLIVEMEGWVSGDDMITIQVQSTISNQTSSDDGSGNIPTTTEKIINTHVRSQSGEPIILSGLKQRETVEEIKKIPLLGDIPLLGYLFQKRRETMKDTEFIITLVPYREEESTGSNSHIYSSLYDEFCRRESP